MTKSYCKNPKCGDEFEPIEVSDGAFCSYDCQAATCGDCGGPMTDGECDDDSCLSHDWDNCPCEGVDPDEDPLDAHDDDCPVRAELARSEEF